jgi:hypothetical protein
MTTPALTAVSWSRTSWSVPYSLTLNWLCLHVGKLCLPNQTLNLQGKGVSLRLLHDNQGT